MCIIPHGGLLQLSNTRQPDQPAFGRFVRMFPTLHIVYVQPQNGYEHIPRRPASGAAPPFTTRVLDLRRPPRCIEDRLALFVW